MCVYVCTEFRELNAINTFLIILMSIKRCGEEPKVKWFGLLWFYSSLTIVGY